MWTKGSSVRNLQTVSRASLILGVGSLHDVFCHIVVCHVVTGHAPSCRIFRIVWSIEKRIMWSRFVSCHALLWHATSFHVLPLLGQKNHVMSCEILSMPM